MSDSQKLLVRIADTMAAWGGGQRGGVGKELQSHGSTTNAAAVDERPMMAKSAKGPHRTRVLIELMRTPVDAPQMRADASHWKTARPSRIDGCATVTQQERWSAAPQKTM